jgi:hypothetical protein
LNELKTVKQEDKPEFPIDRTLEVISFDEDLKSIQPILRKIGKIRKYITGQTILK